MPIRVWRYQRGNQIPYIEHSIGVRNYYNIIWSRRGRERMIQFKYFSLWASIFVDSYKRGFCVCTQNEICGFYIFNIIYLSFIHIQPSFSHINTDCMDSVKDYDRKWAKRQTYMLRDMQIRDRIPDVTFIFKGHRIPVVSLVSQD
jgi:hypothetical protein